VGASAGLQLEARGKEFHAAGDYVAALEQFELAYESYRRDGELLAAARAARTVGWFRGWVLGEWALYQGWSRRAYGLIEQADAENVASAHGWRLLEEARAGTELEDQRRLYLAAIDSARRWGDADLECEAIASLGIMLVFSGRVSEGMAHLDDAMAAVCGGDVEELAVVEGCLCGLLNACERTYDVSRAQDWLRAAQAIIERRRLIAVAGYCRAHYGSILVAAGKWAEAEEEFLASLRLVPEGSAVRATALCRLADLRVRQGRLAEATALLEGLESSEDAARPLAALHLARGHPESALEVLDRARSRDGLPDYEEAPLLALTVAAEVARGALDPARDAAARLTELARNQPSPHIRALAAMTRAQLCTSTGDGDARACLHEAMSSFAEARMPVELARCRLELARVLAQERPAAATAEATAAFQALDGFGAAPEADAAASFVRSLGGSARTGPKAQGALTKREAEVFVLLGEGLTNAEIGTRLFISPKTVEHHVGRILAKLGLRTRAEAAARAVRTGSGQI
jgi:DNA-binding NarL/FixJ family response regulator